MVAGATLFISDLHLEPGRPAVTQALFDFLDRHRQCAGLYILGDLFEAWLGDDDDAPLGGEVADALRDFSAAGPPVRIMRGNRDFLLGQAFCERAGAQLLDEPAVCSVGGQRCLLLHGDSLCTRDVDYQAFRAQRDDPQWRAQLLAMSLPQRRALAASLREGSRRATRDKPEDIMDVTPEEVERSLRQWQVSRLIHGHTHRPAHHRHRHGERWVLGDWEQSARYLKVSDEGWRLEDWRISD